MSTTKISRPAQSRANRWPTRRWETMSDPNQSCVLKFAVALSWTRNGPKPRPKPPISFEVERKAATYRSAQYHYGEIQRGLGCPLFRIRHWRGVFHQRFSFAAEQTGPQPSNPVERQISGLTTLGLVQPVPCLFCVAQTLVSHRQEKPIVRDSQGLGFFR